MTDVIDALRTIRHSGKFEPCLSTLTVAIGDVERLRADEVLSPSVMTWRLPSTPPSPKVFRSWG